MIPVLHCVYPKYIQMDLEKYQQSLAEDFAKDEDFVRWVLHRQPADAAFWKQFVLTHSHKAPELDAAESLILFSRNSFSEERLSETEKKQLHRQIMKELHLSQRNRPANSRVGFPKLRWAAAACLLIVCGLALYALVGNNDWQHHETAYGETRTISLPDGSQVQLNANSRLRFDGRWEAGEDRNVWLAGEAYFEVTKQEVSGAKFSVHTEDMVIQVLGTRFNVNSRNAKTRVVLNEGKIKLMLHDPERESIQMDPGDMVEYVHKEKQLVQHKVNPELHSSWKEGVQLFDKTPLVEVIGKMEEIYGVTIQLQDTSLMQRKMTIGIPVEDLGIALKTIESVLGLEISRRSQQEFIIQ